MYIVFFETSLVAKTIVIFFYSVTNSVEVDLQGTIEFALPLSMFDVSALAIVSDNL
jgi:hypothetical protein